jgi:hypothetical protein
VSSKRGMEGEFYQGGDKLESCIAQRMWTKYFEHECLKEP